MSHSEMPSRMQELARRYRERTAADARTIDAQFALWQQGDMRALREIEALVHRMRGGGGMFGLDDITECAAAVETWIGDYKQRHALNAAQPSVATPSSADSTALQALIAPLRAAIDGMPGD